MDSGIHVRIPDLDRRKIARVESHQGASIILEEGETVLHGRLVVCPHCSFWRPPEFAGLRVR